MTITTLLHFICKVHVVYITLIFRNFLRPFPTSNDFIRADDIPGVEPGTVHGPLVQIGRIWYLFLPITDNKYVCQFNT